MVKDQVGEYCFAQKEWQKSVRQLQNACTNQPFKNKIILNVCQRRLEITASIKVRDTQCGFACGKSTTDGIHLLKGVAETYYEGKRHLHLVVVDSKKAFDMHYCLRNCGILVWKRMWCDCLRISTSTQIVSSVGKAGWQMSLRRQSEYDKAVHVPFTLQPQHQMCHAGVAWTTHHTQGYQM